MRVGELGNLGLGKESGGEDLKVGRRRRESEERVSIESKEREMKVKRSRGMEGK